MIVFLLVAGFLFNWGIASGVLKGSLVAKLILWISVFILSISFARDFDEFLAVLAETLLAFVAGLFSRALVL